MFRLLMLLCSSLPNLGICQIQEQETLCLQSRYELDNDGVDLTQGGYDGVLLGPTPTTDRFGRAGLALEFDGIDRVELLEHNL